MLYFLLFEPESDFFSFLCFNNGIITFTMLSDLHKVLSIQYEYPHFTERTIEMQS